MSAMYLFWIMSVVLLQKCESHHRCFWDYIRQMFDPQIKDDGPKDLMLPSQLLVQGTCAAKNRYHNYLYSDNQLNRVLYDIYLKSQQLKNDAVVPNTELFPESGSYIFDLFKGRLFLNLYPTGLIFVFIYVVLLQFYWNKKIQDPTQMGEIIKNFTQCLQDIISAQEHSGKELKIKVEQLSNVIMPLPDPFTPLHAKEEIVQYLQETMNEIKQNKEVTPEVMKIFTPACLNNLVNHFMMDPTLNRNLEMITTENLITFARGNYIKSEKQTGDVPTIGLDFAIKIQYGDE